MTKDRSLLKPHDMEAEGIPEAHVSGIDLNHRAPALEPAQIRSLPEPVLSGAPDWIDLYWRTWAIAFDRVRVPDPKTGFQPFCDAAFSENIFQWDTCFLIGFVRFAVDVLPVYQTLDNFYSKQHPDGFICREISSVTGRDFWSVDHPSAINPPLFSDAEWTLFQTTADQERLSRVYPALDRYHSWIRNNRRHCDDIGYWTTALASGMDNTPRAFLTGGADADQHYGHSWLCMTSQQALSARHLSEIADILGRTEDRDHYLFEHAQLVRYIEQRYWNDTLGFYVDTDPSGAQTDVLTPAGLWPILAGAGTPAQHDRMFEVITDPKRFWRPHVIPSVAADHPTYHHAGNYWQGSVWPPMVMLAIRAARETGRHRLATKIAENHLQNLTDVYRSTGTLWENYAPEYARRGNVSRPEFVGWSGCGPIEALLETNIGIRVNAATSHVTWTSLRSDTHGIKNLPLGAHRVSLVLEPATNTIAYEASVPLALTLNRLGKTHAIHVSPGSGVLELPE